MLPAFQIGSEDWWRLRRLKLSGVSESLTELENTSVIRTNDPLEIKALLNFVKKRYEELEIVPPSWVPPSCAGPFFAAYLKDSEGPASCAALIEKNLPSERVFTEEIRRIRKWFRRKPAEVTFLATKPDLRARNTIFHLFKAIYRYALSRKITDLLVGINPKHADFYEKVLLFERLGPRREHPFLPGLSVVLEHLDLKKAKERYFRVYGAFPREFNLYHFFIS